MPGDIKEEISSMYSAATRPSEIDLAYSQKSAELKPGFEKHWLTPEINISLREEFMEKLTSGTGLASAEGFINEIDERVANDSDDAVGLNIHQKFVAVLRLEDNLLNHVYGKIVNDIDDELTARNPDIKAQPVDYSYLQKDANQDLVAAIEGFNQTVPQLNKVTELMAETLAKAHKKGVDADVNKEGQGLNDKQVEHVGNLVTDMLNEVRLEPSPSKFEELKELTKANKPTDDLLEEMTSYSSRFVEYAEQEGLSVYDVINEMDAQRMAMTLSIYDKAQDLSKSKDGKKEGAMIDGDSKTKLNEIVQNIEASGVAYSDPTNKMPAPGSGDTGIDSSRNIT